jgi:hypothetical protein
MQKLRINSGLVLPGTSEVVARGDKADLLIGLKQQNGGDCRPLILAQTLEI